MVKKIDKNAKNQQLRNADETLWRQIKAAAALDGKTLTEWVEQVAREKLNLKPE